LAKVAAVDGGSGLTRDDAIIYRDSYALKDTSSSARYGYSDQGPIWRFVALQQLTTIGQS
jgi:hypothetical protein